MFQIHNPQVRKLLDLVSPRVGIVRSLDRLSRGVEEPPLPFIYRAVLCHYDFKNSQLQERATAGKGLTHDGAIGGALGEAVERYCAYHPDVRAIRQGLVTELDATVITPAECVLYSAAQYGRKNFAYRPWTEKTPIGWLAGRELPSDRKAYLPAYLVYLNYYGQNGEDNYCSSTSSGLAAAPDLDSAILAAFCELAERDGFLAHWMNRLPAPEVEFEGGIAAEIRQHYRMFGIETRVFNVTTDLPIYAFMAVSLCDEPSSPSAIFGLGCGLNPRVALEKALFEICQVRPGEAAKFMRDGARDLQNYADIKTLRDHSAFMMRHERRHELSFLLESGRRQHLQDLPNHASGNPRVDLQTAVDGLVQAGSRVAYADLTTDDIKPFGVRVVRAIATGLQPIHFGYGEERLGCKRLFELPRILNYASATRTEADLNPCPHPLA